MILTTPAGLPLTKAFHRVEDKLRAAETEEQKRYRMCDAEVEGGLGIYNDPYAPWAGGGGAMASPSTTRPRRPVASKIDLSMRRGLKWAD
ncbi:hypothetical protein B0H11DRAFT_2266205 [Mycena galericulata]|nr:hypothetical protein B0H11DRAFT_2266205 [Mycena galericulata]